MDKASAITFYLVFNCAKKTGLLFSGFSAFVEDGQNLSTVHQPQMTKDELGTTLTFMLYNKMWDRNEGFRMRVGVHHSSFYPKILGNEKPVRSRDLISLMTICVI